MLDVVCKWGDIGPIPVLLRSLLPPSLLLLLLLLLLLQSFLAVPIIASGSAGSIIGGLSFGLTSITDWGLAWWMSSIQLLCGWAAGALPQNRATARVAFFDALWSATDLQDLGRVFVTQLPSAMADQVRHGGLCGPGYGYTVVFVEGGEFVNAMMLGAECGGACTQLGHSCMTGLSRLAR
jgi:hypothetical protein